MPMSASTGLMLQCAAVYCSVLQCVAVCCSVMQYAVVCCSVLQCVVVCCSMLQCVAWCCSVLQCVACCRQCLAEYSRTRDAEGGREKDRGRKRGIVCVCVKERESWD